MNMTKDEFVAMLRDSLACVLRQKVADGKVVIASKLGIDGLAIEAANNIAAAPWLEISSERDQYAETLAAANEWREDTLHELRECDAILERAGIDHSIGDEPLELHVRVGMLAGKVLASHAPPPPVARGPIVLDTCQCSAASYTCVVCNKLPPTKEQP